MTRLPQRRVCLLLLALVAAAPAFAGPRFGGGWGQPPGRQAPQREWRDDAAPRRQPDEQPGGQRMTPDERRQLRRDLHDAGRDVYPQPRRDLRELRRY